MPSIHFICRDRLNLHKVDGSAYESGVWDLPREDAARLVGGMIYLHQTKADASYFGGQVESFREVVTDEARSVRIVFKFVFTPSARGAKWRGANHNMAWNSGILD